MMLIAANDDRRLLDDDDAQDAKDAARLLLIRKRTKTYSGRTDLFDLAIATCLELRREQGAFNLLARSMPIETEAQREERRRHWKPLLARINKIAIELEAICEALDRDSQKRFFGAINHLPLPDQLVAE
jgi:hypothetical protein